MAQRGAVPGVGQGPVGAGAATGSAALPAVAAPPRATDADCASDRFVAAFDAFAQAIRRARGVTGDHPGHLTFSQYALLRTLADRDGARVSDLAGQAAVTPSTATRILDALERRAIVSRTRSAHDRRGVTVRLTDAGRQALERQDAWIQSRQRDFYAQ